jgi:hypothetical protein
MYFYVKMLFIPIHCYVPERAFLHQLKVVPRNIINLITANIIRIRRQVIKRDYFEPVINRLIAVCKFQCILKIMMRSYRITYKSMTPSHSV